MRTTTVLALLALSGLTTLAPAPAQACGPYGAPSRDLVGHVEAETPASAGLSVRAICGDQVLETAVGEDGWFFFALPAATCTIEATAHECYTSDRSISRRVTLPAETLRLVIPDATAS